MLSKLKNYIGMFFPKNDPNSATYYPQLNVIDSPFGNGIPPIDFYLQDQPKK